MKKVLLSILLLVIFFNFVFSQEDYFFVDKTLAVIDGEPITYLDYYTFLIILKKNKNDLCNTLHEIIKIVSVNKEFHSSAINITSDEVIKEEEKIIKEYGGIENLNKLKIKYQIEESFFKEKLFSYVRYKKLVVFYLEERISVRFDEIKYYYESVYVKERANLGLKPLPFPQVFSIIEEKLRKKKSLKEKKKWIDKIISKHSVRVLVDCKDENDF